MTSDANDPSYESVENVLVFLALCHSIEVDQDTGKYISASPDETALVEGVAAQGYIFRGRDPESNIISVERKRDGVALQYELLCTLAFNGLRKRMSVVVRNCKTNVISILCKGADSIVKGYLDNNSE